MANLTGSYVSGLVQGDVLVVSFNVPAVRDTTLAYALRDEIISMVNSTHMHKVVLDMVNVRFIGSVGFLAFLGVRRHLAGGRIVLCNLAAPVREVFTACRLISTENSGASPFEAAASLTDALVKCSEMSTHA